MNKFLKILLMVVIMAIVLGLIACGFVLGFILIRYLFGLIAPYMVTIKMFLIPIIIIVGLILLLCLIPIAINWLCFLALLIWQKLNKEKPKTELPVFDKHPPVSAPQPTPYPTKTIPAYEAEKLGIKLEPTAAPAVNLEKPTQDLEPQPEETMTLE